MIGLDWANFTFRTGIGPEIFAFSSADGDYTGGSPPTPAQTAFYKEHGFYITAPDYILRPEVLESNFYAWRVTGDSKYVVRAAQAMESFKKYLQVESKGYAGIYNVTDNGSSGEARAMVDDTESFWFAEVLKYLYAHSFCCLESIKVDLFFLDI